MSHFDATPFPGDKLITIAARNEDFDTIKRLLDSGAYVDDCGARDMTALHVVTYQRHLELVELLLANGANVEAIDEDKETPLYSAASATQGFLPKPFRDRPLLPIVQVLLDAGARPDSFSCLYRTPARATDEPEVREVLIQAEKVFYEAHPDALPVDAAWGEVRYDNQDLLAVAQMNRSSGSHLPMSSINDY